MFEENKEVNEKAKWIGLSVFIIILLLFIRFTTNEREEYKKTFKGEAIALSTRIEHADKTTFLRYYFYLNKRVLSKGSLSNYNGDEHELVNKFYKVKYDLNNPEKGNYIIFEHELEPDSISLVKAGFTKIKYYIYDAGVTCKYIEKSKWK